jgi:hypothetical protein
MTILLIRVSSAIFISFSALAEYKSGKSFYDKEIGGPK